MTSEPAAPPEILPEPLVAPARRLVLPIQVNEPALWKNAIKAKAAADNKYDHGHVLVYGGELMTGAACLAAQGALRAGAGLCTISAPVKRADVYRAYLPNIIVEERVKISQFRKQMKDRRRNAIVIGPGAGMKHRQDLRDLVYHIVRDGRPCVLDADALSVFKNWRRSFHKALGSHCVLTPHEGEFERIFPGMSGDRTERALAAAKKSQAVVLLKGGETVIAHPDGRVVVNQTATPALATAGTGDVLAGLIAGLLARGTAPFEAACAGAWIQGRAGQLAGEGLMATDLFAQIPAVLRELA